MTRFLGPPLELGLVEPDSAEATASGEVTVVWSRQAKPGCQAALENVIERLAKAMATAPGYERGVSLRPRAGHPPIYTMVAHFASQADLDTCVSSKIRGRLFAEAERVSVGGLNVQQAAGLEGWFQMPDQTLVAPHPRYKMAIITWLAILSSACGGKSDCYPASHSRLATGAPAPSVSRADRTHDLGGDAPDDEVVSFLALSRSPLSPNSKMPTSGMGQRRKVEQARAVVQLALGGCGAAGS